MSYTLYRVRWKINRRGTVSEKYSFHINQEDAARFMREEIMEQLTRDPTVLFRTEGSSEINHAPGKLYAEVKSMRESTKPKYGVWKDSALPAE